MLTVHYYLTKEAEQTAVYKTVDAFMTAQLKEVPDLQDNYLVSRVVLDGKELTHLAGQRISQVFAYLSKS